MQPAKNKNNKTDQPQNIPQPKNHVTFITEKNLYSGKFWNNPKEITRYFGHIIKKEEEEERLGKVKNWVKSNTDYRIEYIGNNMQTKIEKSLKRM